MTMPDYVAGLLGFIDRSPTPYHAVAQSEARLAELGFQRLSEADAWELEPGARHTVVRGDGSVVAC